jgi:hypothetical protein
MVTKQIARSQLRWFVILAVACTPTAVASAGLFSRPCVNPECSPAYSDFFGYYPTCWRDWPPGGPVCPVPLNEGGLPYPVMDDTLPPGVIPASARFPARLGKKVQPTNTVGPQTPDRLDPTTPYPVPRRQ